MMKATKSKLIKLLSLFMLLSLSLYAESLTDGKGVFKSNKLIKHLLFKNNKIHIYKISIEKLNNVSIEILFEV